MTGTCCKKGAPLRPLIQRLAGVATPLLPGVVLLLLPKWPLCLAASLTLATGLSVSAVEAARMHELLVIVCVVAAGLGATLFVRRRASRSWPFRPIFRTGIWRPVGPAVGR